MAQEQRDRQPEWVIDTSAANKVVVSGADRSSMYPSPAEVPPDCSPKKRKALQEQKSRIPRPIWPAQRHNTTRVNFSSLKYASLIDSRQDILQPRPLGNSQSLPSQENAERAPGSPGEKPATETEGPTDSRLRKVRDPPAHIASTEPPDTQMDWYDFDFAVCLVLDGMELPLTYRQMMFDAPNNITLAFEREGQDTGWARAGVLTLSGRRVHIAPRGDIAATGTRVACLEQPNRPPLLFEKVLLPYLSGEAVFPLTTKARIALLSCCKEDEDPLDVLYGEANFWGFANLQELVVQEKSRVKSPASDMQLSKAFLRSLAVVNEQTEEEEEDEESTPSSRLFAEQRRTAYEREMARRYRASCSKVKIWLVSLSNSPELAKPSNTTYMKTLGWKSGLRFYNVGPVVHESRIDSDDLAAPEETPGYTRSVEYFIRNDSKCEEDDQTLSFKTQAAIRSSVGDFTLVAQQTLNGGAFHKCMQNKLGRHGLHILYKPGWVTSCPPLRKLEELLVIGYYRRGSREIASHPHELWHRVLPENRWVAPLFRPLCDDDFINKEVDIRGKPESRFAICSV